MIEKYNIRDTMELILGDDCIILKPKAAPRKGWDQVFKEIHEKGVDKLLLDDVFNDEDFEEW